MDLTQTHQQLAGLPNDKLLVSINEEEAQTLLLAIEKLTKQLKKSGFIRTKTAKSTSIENISD